MYKYNIVFFPCVRTPCKKLERMIFYSESEMKKCPTKVINNNNNNN